MASEESSADRVFLLMICETLFAQRIGELLDELGLPGHTSFSGVSGLGRSGRREDSDIWPGGNSIILVALPDDAVADEVVTRAERIIADDYRKRPGFAAFKLHGTQLA